jgi:hypothetical protein
MKTTAFLFLIAFVSLLRASTEDVEIQVDVFGGKGAGKFDRANITREENKVLQAPFAGGDGSTLNQVIAAPDGSLYFCGSLGDNPLKTLPFSSASDPEGSAFVAHLTPDARTLKSLLRLPREFTSARRLAIAPDGTVVVAGESSGELSVARVSGGLDEILWTKKVTGDTVASLAVAPDNSVVVCPSTIPFVSRIAPDGSKLIPFGNSQTFRIDGANPEIFKAWWEGCGYAAAGYKGGATYLRGGNAGVAALPDGTFVLFSSNFLRHPGGGPDFDLMLLKFNGDGKILWCTNLLDGLPAESDQKSPSMLIDPYTGDLLLCANQHGHFKHNLIFTDGAYQNPHPYITGDITIGWVARVDPATGKPKAATYFFPEIPGSLVGGKKRANSLFLIAAASDKAGNLYVTGASAYKFETTLHAFQSEGNSGAFIAAFSPKLDRLLYASLITEPGSEIEPTSIAVAPGGPVTVGNFSPKKSRASEFSPTNADVTNYLLPHLAGPRGSFLNYTPSGPWLN